jgi:PKD repeat protein
MQNNPLDKFEQGIQEAYKNYELPYSSSEWTQVSRKILRKRLFTSLALWGSAAVVVTAIGVASYLVLSNPKNTSSVNTPNSAEVLNPVPSTIPSEDDSLQKTGSNDLLQDFNTNSLQMTAIELANMNANTSNLSSSNQNSEAPEIPVVEPSPEVVEISKTSLFIEPSVRNACAGTEVNFNAKNSPKNGSYLWNFGDGSFSNQENPVHIYKTTGTFDVSLSVTDPNNGAISTIAMRDLITINPKPEADFEWTYTNSPAGEPTAKFVNTSINANSFVWKFSENKTSTEISPSVIYNSKGKQAVILEVHNSYGCKDEQIKIVQVNADFNLGAESAMSAKEISFMPDALKKGGNKFQLTVYDGENIIFESTSKTKPWKGETKGGKKAIAGQQYPWIVLIYGENGTDARYYSGKLTIVP